MPRQAPHWQAGNGAYLAAVQPSQRAVGIDDDRHAVSAPERAFAAVNEKSDDSEDDRAYDDEFQKGSLSHGDTGDVPSWVFARMAVIRLIGRPALRVSPDQGRP